MSSPREAVPIQELNNLSSDENVSHVSESPDNLDDVEGIRITSNGDVFIEVNRKTISQIDFTVKNVSHTKAPNWTYSPGFCNDRSIFLFGFCMSEDSYVICVQFVSLRSNVWTTPLTRVRFHVKPTVPSGKPFAMEGLYKFEKLNEYFSGRIPKDHISMYLENDCLLVSLDFSTTGDFSILPEPLTELKTGSDEIFWWKMNDFANIPVNGSRLSETYKIRDEQFELYVARTTKMFMVAIYCNRRGRSSSILRFGNRSRDPAVHAMVKIAIVSPDNNPRIPAEALTTFSHHRHRIMWIFDYNRVKDLLPFDKSFLWVMLKVSILNCYPVRLIEVVKERKKLENQVRTANIRLQEQQNLIRELSELTLSTEDESDHSDSCIICMSRRVDTMIEPCRHVVLCCVDAGKIKSMSSPSSPAQCPSCRGPIEDMIKIFLP
jgi:hypothetical protein